jgi:hypothetical protein
LEEKYRQKVRQFDTEQLESKKLEEEVEKLQTQIQQLTQTKPPLPKE